MSSDRWTRVRGPMGVFLGFTLLTFGMTWPWVARLSDAVSDEGDPYLNAWILWWDFHQTFHDPLRLFHANIFFPYQYTLAFSEHNYGLALPLFPLFALGVTPLAVHGVAILLGFTLSGFGAFRLTRTLTGSTGAAWVAGIGFAFTLYRWHQLPHVNYVSSGWIPLLIEALVLFARDRTRGRAAWLGTAFFLNALSCVHWFVLTLVPLAVTAVVLVLRNGAERDPRLYRRGAVALGIAGLALLPFLLPYRRAAQLYGFTRGEAETLSFSAKPAQWLNADPSGRFWHSVGEESSPGELCLFPGLLLLLLPLGAFLLVPAGAREPSPGAPRTEAPRALLVALDVVALAAGMVALFATAWPIRLTLLGSVVKVSDGTRALALLAACLLVRCSIAWPRALRSARHANLVESLRRPERPDAFAVGLVLAVVGFLGSLGLNSPFHRFFYETFEVFRSVRVPARYAMVGHLGLAVLAGLGALLLSERVRASRRPLVFLSLAVLLLVELRHAPLDLRTGLARPDAVTRFLARTPMRGGIVQLPSGGVEHGNYIYVLRAADHAKPLVNGISGFATPLVVELEEITAKRPVPDALLDLLERIPASYLTVHESWLPSDERHALQPVLARGLETGRLRYVGRFDSHRKTHVYAVAKTEPDAGAGVPFPWIEAGPAEPPAVEDPSLLGNLDAPAENALVRGPLVLEGWARIPDEDLEVRIVIDGELRRAESVERLPRPDVAAAVPRLGDCSKAGFRVTFALLPGDEGDHELSVTFRSRDSRARHLRSVRFRWGD